MRAALFLLFVSVWINYIDRGSLSVAAPALAPDLGLAPDRMGILLSAFFWTYALLQPVAGWLVDRADVGRLYGIAFLLWSAATLATGFAGGFASLLVLRMILGAAESVAYPAYSRILAHRYPEHRRGFANALVDIGTKAGPALGTAVGGTVLALWGWRAMFLVLGSASLIWVGPWFHFGRRAFHMQDEEASGGASVRDVLRRPVAWTTFSGLFCFNYAYYFLLTWLPSYLVKERGFSLGEMSVYAALPYCATAAASLACAWVADRLIAGGKHPVRVRGSFVIAGMVVCAAVLPLATVARHGVSMAFLIAAFIAMGVYSANVWAMTQTLAGPQLAGTWTGLQNAAGNMGGVVAPVITGLVVRETGSFFLAFAASALFLLLGVAIYVFGLRDKCILER
jgi:MFS transporter, ACS family, D-galactonate transporter